MAGAEAILLEDRRLHVASEGEAVAVRRMAKELALEAGFSKDAAEEIVLAVGELASNIVRHAGIGQITLSTIQQDDTVGIRVEVDDRGRGIADPDEALVDGFSTAGGLGFGLGTVNRFMDQLDFVSPGKESRGTHIQCVRWNRPAPARNVPDRAEVGAVSRQKPGQTVNGDAYLVVNDGETWLAAVIDGLGHGNAAHEASMSARQYVETHSREPLGRIIKGAGHNCRSTKGAVMAVIRIDWRTGVLEHTGLGNIETRLLSEGAPATPLSRRGILGVDTPEVRVSRLAWRPGDLAVMFSDGLKSSWEWAQFPMARLMPAQELASHMFDELVREDDDATILVVKYKTG